MTDLTASILALLLTLPAIIVLFVLIGRRLGDLARASSLFAKARLPARERTNRCRGKFCGKLDACPT